MSASFRRDACNALTVALQAMRYCEDRHDSLLIATRNEGERSTESSTYRHMDTELRSASDAMLAARKRVDHCYNVMRATYDR